MKEKTRNDSGIYLLLIHLGKAANIPVGALGRHHFPAGYYVYAGSAQRGLRARLRRHAARHKRRRWHVDHLTAMAQVVGTLAFSGGKEFECRLSRAVGRLPGARLHIRRFGASDCRCEGHLHHFAARPALPALLDRLMRLAIIRRGCYSAKQRFAA